MVLETTPLKKSQTLISELESQKVSQLAAQKKLLEANRAAAHAILAAIKHQLDSQVSQVSRVTKELRE